MIPKALSIFLFVTAIFLVPPTSHADELILAADGKSDYQIILPDQSLSPAISASLQQTARLIQTAFKSNGVDLEVITESKKANDNAGIYLGNTSFAKQNGIDVSQLKGWSYVHKTIGRNIIIAGYDHPSPGQTGNSRRPDWDRLGTTKGVTDFLRIYVGTRFLYPDLSNYQAVNKAGDINLLLSPSIEFLPLKKISVPADLDIQHTPGIEFNVAHPITGGFYDIANNRFPKVDAVAGSHTYERAIPIDPYRKTHPEYFSLIKGKRLLEGKNGQYCISNPEVQELIYKDLLKWLDRGYETVDLGQPDGFRACECENCQQLFDTGDDWSEKLWIFHRNLAERLLKDRPDNRVMMMSYILTAKPPKSFKSFPKNARIMLTGTNEKDIALWRVIDVPGGFDGYVYNWTPNLTSRYTPMRTPAFVEKQVKRLVENNIHSLYRDGPGTLYGLEGPVYYIMGRMFDDAENLQAKDLMEEFTVAAFGNVAPQMKPFYNQLYHSIEIYAQHLGTRDPAWTYQPIEGRGRKHLSDPFRMLGFLYPPKMLASLESQLSLAEKRAKENKVKVRLALVRRELNYVKSLAKVIHLHTAYQIQPDLASRDRLLDAIDERNKEIASYYDKRRSIPVEGWKVTLFPPGGHNYKHLRLAHNLYQGPFEDTAFNWDTKAMRDTPLPGSKRLKVLPVENPLSLDSVEWKNAKTFELNPLKSRIELAHKTLVKALYDKRQIYLRIKSTLPADKTSGPQKQDLLAIYLKPTSSPDISYRFIVSPAPDSKREAASGFISDAMDPRHDQYDPDWNADWTYQTNVNATTHQWSALITIPFASLGVKESPAGTFWRGNISRVQSTGPEQVEQSIWSGTVSTRRLDDRNAFGEFVFEKTNDKKP